VRVHAAASIRFTSVKEYTVDGFSLKTLSCVASRYKIGKNKSEIYIFDYKPYLATLVLRGLRSLLMPAHVVTYPSQSSCHVQKKNYGNDSEREANYREDSARAIDFLMRRRNT
jgi:hypothetical protein